MKEYFILNNDYDKKEKTIIFNNEDYKLSFINKSKGGNIIPKIKYIEIEQEDLKKFLTEQQIEDIETILYDKKIKKMFPTKHDIRINKNGKIEISIKPVNNKVVINNDLFI